MRHTGSPAPRSRTDDSPQTPASETTRLNPAHQTGYFGSLTETWPDRPPTVPADRRPPHRHRPRSPACLWPIQTPSPEPYSTYRLPTPTTRPPHRPARRSMAALSPVQRYRTALQ